LEWTVPLSKITFRHVVVRAAYEAAEREVADLPASERATTLATIAARLQSLDVRPNIADGLCALASAVDRATSSTLLLARAILGTP
jgi:hypothetical protein